MKIRQTPIPISTLVSGEPPEKPIKLIIIKKDRGSKISLFNLNEK
jgi:hypothetical protein